MIVIKGKIYYTIADAAKEFGVASKTVYDWIEREIIARPPVIRYGIRHVQIFPREYMGDAKRRIEHYQRKNSE